MNTLIHFKTKDNYKLSNIPDTSIAFIKDSKQISTHDTEYSFVNWNVLDESSSVQERITFTFEENIYEALLGQTWAEWCNSSYNTIGFTTTWDNYGQYYSNVFQDSDIIQLQGGQAITGNNLIIDKAVYIRAVGTPPGKV